MAFLVCESQKALLALQRNEVRFEQTLLQSRLLVVTKSMSNMQATSQKTRQELEGDADYLALEDEEEFLTVRKENLDAQIQMLDQQVSSMGDAVKQGMKDSCKLNLSGGGS